MPKVSKEIEEILKGLRCEIGANMVLAPSNDYNKGWNDGSANALKFIGQYLRGEGLFQD